MSKDLGERPDPKKLDHIMADLGVSAKWTAEAGKIFGRSKSTRRDFT